MITEINDYNKTIMTERRALVCTDSNVLESKTGL